MVASQGLHLVPVDRSLFEIRFQIRSSRKSGGLPVSVGTDHSVALGRGGDELTRSDGQGRGHGKFVKKGLGHHLPHDPAGIHRIDGGVAQNALDHVRADLGNARVQVDFGQGPLPDRQVACGIVFDEEGQHRLGHGVREAGSGDAFQDARRILGLDDPDFGNIGQGCGLGLVTQQGQQEGGQGGLEESSSSIHGNSGSIERDAGHDFLEIFFILFLQQAAMPDFGLGDEELDFLDLTHFSGFVRFLFKALDEGTDFSLGLDFFGHVAGILEHFVRHTQRLGHEGIALLREGLALAAQPFEFTAFLGLLNRPFGQFLQNVHGVCRSLSTMCWKLSSEMKPR